MAQDERARQEASDRRGWTGAFRELCGESQVRRRQAPTPEVAVASLASLTSGHMAGRSSRVAKATRSS
eukprot:scaffold1596_cov302-Pinguiococcus_pyrenoidosus.AAC.20